MDALELSLREQKDLLSGEGSTVVKLAMREELAAVHVTCEKDDVICLLREEREQVELSLLTGGDSQERQKGGVLDETD